MISMSQLWLPILLSAVAVFLVSSAIHMASPWHKGDFPRMANEEQVMDAMRPLNLAPGDYFFPRPANMGDLRSPEFIARTERGPVVLMTVMPNRVTGMGKNLAAWFVYSLVVSFLAAHTAQLFRAGEPYKHVFHQVALVAFTGYVLALWQMTIWYRRSMSMTLKATVDGLVYALVTAAVFAWLWPR